MFLLLLVIALVQGKTVRYSNIPPRGSIATRAYDLEVPGSAPIRIIEAEPIWTTEQPNTTPFYHHLEHRSNKPKRGRHYFTTESTKTTISEPTHEPEHATVYSPEALNKFLKNYAQRVKADRKKFSVDGEFDHTEEPYTEEPINKLASIYLENEEKANEDDKQKSWGPVNVQHHKHPYEDKKGWVSLDAVPWSTSKISKWQSNNKNEPKPWENNKPSQSSWNNRPKNPFLNHDNGNNYDQNGYNDNSNKYNHNPFLNHHHNHHQINDKNYFPPNNEDQYNPNENMFFDKPTAIYDQDIRPSNDFPTHYPERPNRPYGYDKPIKKPEPPTNWQDEMPSRPSFVLRPVHTPQTLQWSSNNNNNNQQDSWPQQSPQFMYAPHGYNNKDERPDIITDGRPGDFPKQSNPPQQPNYHHQQHQEPEDHQDHPPSHPANGNGEWVLVSTTKGYQYPRSKHQRSIDVTPDSIGTRRGIRLTVLPPDEDTVNMTTSHGGLLEVESTFETVEESQNKYVEIKLHNVTSTRLPHKKKPVRKQVVITPRPVIQNSVINNLQKRRPQPVVINDKQDATALMAAVGAGMIPATMAMLVPFVGRRKRSIETNLERTVNVTNVPMHIYQQRNF